MKREALLFFFSLLVYFASGQAIEWVGSNSAFSDANTTLTLPKPAGTGSGDLILIQAAYTVSTGSITIPSGFNAYVNTGSNGLRYTFCYRVADGTEGSSFALTSSSGRNWIGTIAVYRNVNPGAPFEDINYTFNAMASGATSFAAPAITSTSGDGMLLVFGMGKHTATPATITTPTGMTRRSDTLAANRMILQASLAIGASGSTGAKDITFTAAQGTGGDNGKRYFALSVILRPLRILYSYQSGNFDSTTTWTKDPSVSTLTPSGGATPRIGDSIVVKNGRTVHTSVDKTNLGMGLMLEEGSVLDLQTFTFDGLNSIGGAGRLRSSRTTNDSTYFPTAINFASFLSSGGGIIEYYCASNVTLKADIAEYRHLELKRETSGTTIYTLASNLTLHENLTISRTGSAVSRLVIGNNTTDRTFTIGGNVALNAGCEWRIGSFNSDHTVNVGGNFSNYGSLRFTNQTNPDYADAPTTGTAILNFTGASDASFLCYGQTDLYRLILNKGSDQTYILSVESNDSTYFKLFGTNDLSNNPDDNPNPLVRKALYIQNGTLKLNENIYIPCLTTAGDDFTIPEAGALWVNGAHIVATTGTGTNTGITVIGKLRLSSGRIETGTSTGIQYRYFGATVVEGGYVHASQFRQSEQDGTVHYGSYTQSGGHAVFEGATEDNTHARFSLPNADCVFNMSGGLLEIQYPVNRTGVLTNLIDINTDPANFSVTGGQINAVSDRATELAHISISGSLYKLVLSDNGGESFTSASSLTVSNSLTVGTGNPVLDMADFDLVMEGSLSIATGASLDMGTGTLSFEGAAKQWLTVDGTLTGGLQDLYIDKSDTLEIAGSASTVQVNGLFSLVSGVLNDAGKTMDLRGDVVLSGIHTGTGKILLGTATTRTLSGSGNGVIKNLDFDASADATVTVSCNLRIQGELEFIGTAQRVLDFGAYGLTLDSFATVTNAGSNRFVRFNGQQSAGGLTKRYTSDSFNFPVGSGTGATYDYTPAHIYFTTSPTTYGAVTIKPVASEHIAVTQTGRSLTYYWKTSSTGFTIGSGVLVQEYTYVSGDVVTGTGITEAGYVPANFDIGSGGWVTGSASSINTTTNTITFTGVNFPSINGEFTAGDNSPVSPFGAVTIYYSRVNNGTYADVNTWTTNPDHTTPSPPATIPNANSILRIGNGHTIEVNSNGANAGSLVIAQGSVLDLNLTTGHNFGVVGGGSLGGKGKISMDRNGTTNVFPGGDYGDFLAAGGGEIEYYNSGTSILNLPASPVVYNKLRIDARSTGVIRFPTVDLTINDSLLIASSGSAICYLNYNASGTGNIVVERSLVVSDGILQIDNPTGSPRYYHVKGDVKVLNGASFNIEPGGAGLVHTLEIEGDLNNEGTLNLYSSNTRHIILLFSGADTAYFTGSDGSAATTIYQLTLNKGTDPSYMLVMDIAGTLTTRTSNWLTLQKGTFRFARPGAALTIWDNNASFEIPSGSALSVDNPTATLNLALDNQNAADLILGGRLEVLRGTINVGNTANNNHNDIEIATTGIPEIIVKGGTLNVNGSIRRSLASTSGSLYFSQSGGSTVTIYSRGALQTTRGKLEVANAGSYFAMADSSRLNIARGGAVDYADLYLNPASSAVNGGTIYFQPVSPITGNQTFTINANIALNNIEILPTGAYTSSLQLNTNSLTLAGSLNIATDATFQTNNLNLNLAKSLIKTGTFTGGTGTVNFTTADGVINGDFSAQPIYHLEVDTSAVLRLGGSGTSLRISSMLSIYSGGVLHDSSRLIDVDGDMTNYGEHRSLTNTSSNTLQFTGTGNQLIYGTGIFGNLVVNSGYSVSIQSPVQINRQLTLTNGILEIGANRLTLSETATVSGSFGATNHIRSNGVLSDGGVRKLCATGANNIYFPLGLTGKYTPARINITSSNAAGTVTVRLVNSKHPSTRVPADSQLNVYWQVDTTGFNSLTVTHTYEYVNAATSGTELNYVTGRFLSPNWTPLLGITGTVDTTANTLTLSGVSYIHGGFTAGVRNEFGLGNTYYSRKSSGDWTDLDMWSVTGHNGAALSSPSELPDGSPIVIASGHTVVISGNSKLAESINLLGTAILDVGNTFGHSLGAMTGTGTLRIKATGGGQFIFPAGSFDAFCSASGGTVEFYHSANGTLPTRNEYNNLLFTGSATRTQANVDVTVNGVIRIEGGVVSNTSFGQDLILKSNWVNDVGAAGYVPGVGKVHFASSGSQSIDGITRFHTLEFSGGGAKTLLDSVSVGSQLILNGGRVYLGASNMMLDSFATTAGSPSASAMVVQDGNGRIIKRCKNTSPSFVYPIGEETGTAEYSPLTLAFNSGTFTSQATVSITLTDGNSPVCAGGSHYLSRYWSFSTSGISAYSVTVTGHYPTADINGTESLISARMSRPSLPCVNGSTANTGAHSITFTGSVLNTLAGGEAPAGQPSIQASFLFFTSIGPSQMNLTWTRGNGQRRLVLARESSAVNVTPTDLSSYTANANYSAGPENLGGGNYAVYAASDSSFTLSGLNPSTIYHFAIFEYNNLGTETDYLLTTPLTGVMKTLATEPNLIASDINFDRIQHTSIGLNWAGGNGEKKLVIAREGLPVTASPADRSVYSSNPVFGNGHEFPGEQFVIYSGTADTMTVLGLDQNKRYHFAAFEWNGTDSSSNYYAAQHRADSQHSYLLLELRVLLEGAFINAGMIANNQSNIPGNQPYSGPPYNFGEFNSIQSVPTDSLIDWVLIELRKSPAAAGASPATIRGRAAGFIRPDGRVDDTLAMPGIIVKTDEPGEFFVVVHHRTHISVMSSSHLLEPDQSHPYYGYNFTDSVAKAYGSNALADLGGGKWGMFSGRAENSGTAQVIDDNDRVEMWNDRNKTGYQQTDVNLDGIVDAEDRSKVWNNRNVATQIPQ